MPKSPLVLYMIASPERKKTFAVGVGWGRGMPDVPCNRVPDFIDSVRNFKKPLFFCSWPFREGTNKGGGTASERPKV